MKIYSISDKKFREYGKIVSGDFSELLTILHTKDCPSSGTVYVPSDSEMESLAVAKFLQTELFGGLPIQIGYCNGNNKTLNCLEYHKNSEINIVESETVLLLGKQQDIIDGKYYTTKVVAFHIPAGTAVELYATTLHYAPCGTNFRVAVVLPRGTNYDKPTSAKDPLLWGSNKWLLAHPDSSEAKQGAYVGLIGENISL